MGSAGGEFAAEVMDKAFQLGEEIARHDCIILTGACPGLPHQAVLGAQQHGGLVVGISPALGLDEHENRYRSPYEGYTVIIFTGSGLMGREITTIRSCDIVAIIGGRSGTLGEFAIAYDEGKVIGILEGTDGITEHLQTIVSFVKKETGAVVVCSYDPGELMDRLEQVYHENILPRYQKLVADRDPDRVLEV